MNSPDYRNLGMKVQVHMIFFLGTNMAMARGFSTACQYHLHTYIAVKGLEIVAETHSQCGFQYAVVAVPNSMGLN